MHVNGVASIPTLCNLPNVALETESTARVNALIPLANTRNRTQSVGTRKPAVAFGHNNLLYWYGLRPLKPVFLGLELRTFSGPLACKLLGCKLTRYEYSTPVTFIYEIQILY